MRQSWFSAQHQFQHRHVRQLGQGLRKAQNKDYVEVLIYRQLQEQLHDPNCLDGCLYSKDSAGNR